MVDTRSGQTRRAMTAVARLDWWAQRDRLPAQDSYPICAEPRNLSNTPAPFTRGRDGANPVPPSLSDARPGIQQMPEPALARALRACGLEGRPSATSSAHRSLDRGRCLLQGRVVGQAFELGVDVINR